MATRSIVSRSDASTGYLIEALRLPSEWVGSRIKPLSDLDKRLDKASAAVLTAGGTPFLIVAISPSSPAAARESTTELLRRFPLTPAAVAITPNGEVLVSLRRRFDRDEVEAVSGVSPTAYSRDGSGASPYLNSEHPPALARAQAPLSDRVESLLFELHSDLRDIDGMHADVALDEICKLILVKCADEHTTGRHAAYRLQRWLYTGDDELATVARELHHDLVPQYLAAANVGRQRPLPTTALTAPFICSNAALARLIEQLEPYSLSRSDIDLKARAFQKVVAPGLRAGMGQYFTPLPIIRFMARVADPKPTDRILDPFAGSGHFLAAAFQSVTERMKEASRDAYITHAYDLLHAIEKSDRMVRVALADMLMHGGVFANYHCSDSLLPFDSLLGVEPESFVCILTNPPFGSLLREGAMARLGAFSIAAGRKTVPLEVLGVERCLDFLRPGGRLGIVLPDGLFANPGSAYVRRWILERATPRVIVSLPVATFAPFGANVKTSILFCRKHFPGERSQPDAKVLTCTADDVGYDSTGRDTSTCDLDPLANAVCDFLDKEGW